MRTANCTKGLVVGLILVVCGCAQKLTYERWQTIHDGTTPEVVKATLGEPFQTTEQTWVYQDSDHTITAFIYFKDGQVIGKQWKDLQRGIEGDDPHVKEPGESSTFKSQKIE